MAVWLYQAIVLIWSHLERQAFRWVQKYINIFGGDRSKVTMYVLIGYQCVSGLYS